MLQCPPAHTALPPPAHTALPPPAHTALPPPQRLDLALPDGHPLLSTAARMIAEAKEACADYRHRIETNRNSRVAEAVDTAKELAGGVVGIKYWETRFSELLSKLQSLVVASLTLTAETASSPTADAAAASASDANAPVLEYLSHCFSLVRLECEVPQPPGPADGGFPGFVWTGDDAPYSGRLDVQWERPPGPAVGFDGGADVDADASLYRSRPRRYQLWCERSFDVVQGSLNQLRQLGVDDFLEPTAIGLGRHVMEVESEDDTVITEVVGQSEGLAAGTKYAMAVRAWLNPPPGCDTAWSKWSDWSHIGCTSPTHQVVGDLRCIASSEHGLTIAWSRPAIPTAPPPSPSGVVQVEVPMDESEIDAAAASAGDGGYEYEYQIRMERTGARVQTLQAKVADTAASTIGQLVRLSGVWEEDVAVPAAAVGGGDTPAPAVLAEPEPEPEPEPLISTLNPASTSAGVWDAVGGDTKQQKLEASQHQKLEAALLEAATILPDERAIVRGTVASHEPMVAYRAGAAPTEAEADAWEQEQSDGGIGLGLLGSPRAASPSGSPQAASVLLRAGSREVENLEAGVTYRVSVRARIISENIASASPDGPPTTTDWGGWCPVVDMQTQAATWNPPPIVESPSEGWDVSVGEGCEIRWTGRQQVTEVLFTSRSGVYKHSLLVPTDTAGNGDTGGSFWWRGDLWPGADAAANGLYADTPTPPSFPAFVYLKFVGSDGMETYTPARRVTMEYTPLLQINSPPSGGMVPDYGNADGDTDSTGREPYAVASATAGDPIDIRWEMMEGVKVSSISLNDRSTWLTSAYRGSPPVYTIVSHPELSATATSHLWDGRLGINIVDVAAVITRESDADTLMEAADLAAAGTSPSSAGPAEHGDSGGALPSAKPYDIVVHFTAPADLGGASHSVRVPIDLDEPFEMVSWTGGVPSPARRSAPARQAAVPRVTPLISGEADVSALQLESTDSAEVVVPPGAPASPGAVNI